MSLNCRLCAQELGDFTICALHAFYLTRHKENADMSTPIEPLAHRTDTWMTDNKEKLGILKLHELALPSAHNSGVDKKGVLGAEEGWVACQEDSFYYQLMNGIRVLDLRIRMHRYHDAVAFNFYHGDVESTRTIKHLIDDCRRFFNEGGGARNNEIIIFDINHADSEIGEFWWEVIKSKFVDGLSDILIPPEAASLTLKEINQQYPGKHIILAWAVVGGPMFWGGVQSDWVGEDLPSLAQIREYIMNTIHNIYPPDRLRSLQVVKYSRRYGPEKIGAAINEWFSADSEWLQKSNIINVDFFEASNIVQNCITSNIKKASPIPPSKPVVGNKYQPDDRLLVVSFKSTDNLLVSHYVAVVNGETKTVQHQDRYVEWPTATFKVDFNANFTGSVYAVDNTGLKSQSAVFSGNTGAAPVPGEPQFIGLERHHLIEEDRILAGWLKRQPHGENYEVCIYKADDKGKPIGSAVESTLLPITYAKYTFKNLTPGQGYYITLRQVNVLGQAGIMRDIWVRP